MSAQNENNSESKIQEKQTSSVYKTKFYNETSQKQNRTYKDSLFVDLFGKCPDARENFLSLYNAIHGTNLKLENTEIEPIMLERTVYTGVKDRWRSVFYSKPLRKLRKQFLGFPNLAFSGICRASLRKSDSS